MGESQEEFQARLARLVEDGLAKAGLDNEGQPDDLQALFTPLGADAALAHEMYHGYMEAGFSERQAIYLVASAMTGNPGHPPVN